MKTLVYNSQAADAIEEMEAEVAKMMATLQRLKNSVHLDDLTGLLRRNEFFHRANTMLSQSGGCDAALIMLDVDNFKMINDNDGHVAGDHTLMRIARILQRCSRLGGIVGRFGGEEFAILLPLQRDRAHSLAEALRKQVQREVNVTVSVGVVSAKDAESDLRMMVGLADQALYLAKKTGKNKVCLAA